MNASRTPSRAYRRGPRCRARAGRTGRLVLAVGTSLAAASVMVVAAAAPPLAADLAAQQQTAGLRAIVTSAETGEPVAGATVRVGGEAGKAGRTGEDGRVLIGGIEPGTHEVEVEAPDHAIARGTLDFEAFGVLEIEVSLESARQQRPIPLEPIDVTVEGRSAKLDMVGFYERMDHGLGTFLTPEELAEPVSRAARISDVFRGVSGLRVVLHPTRPGTFILGVPRGRTQLSSGGRPSEISVCTPRIWLDGVRLPHDAAEDINAVTGPREVAAIEVYAGPAELPAQFNVTGGHCGAVLIWTGPRPDPEP